jgi:hypothetical protein
MGRRETDLRMLNELLNDHADELTGWETEAFADMRLDLTGHVDHLDWELSPKQRDSVRAAYERIKPQYENLVSRGLVPRGREVPTPAVLQHLPKRPPVRKREES